MAQLARTLKTRTMTTPKKMFFIAGTLGQGGAEKQLYYLVKELLLLGYDVKVACLIKGEYWQAELEKLGINVLHISKRGKVSRLRQIHSMLKKSKPDLVFSMHFFTNFYGALPAKLLGIKSVGSIRSNGFHEIEHLGKLMGALCYYVPNIIIANSVHGAENMAKIFPGRKQASVLPNAVELSAYDHLPFKALPDVPVLLVIARLIPLKRVHLFIELIGRLNALNMPCKGIIVGYGPEENRLKHLVEDGMQHDSIMFAGKQADVRPWIKKAYALISVSSHEGTSNVYLEAMASGVPVVALHFDGIELLIEDSKDGFIYKNLEDMTIGCRNLLKNLSLRNSLGQQARQKIENNFDSKKVVHTFLHLTEI